MKILLIATTCGALVMSAAGTTFAAQTFEPAPTIQHKSGVQQANVTRPEAGAIGIWPSHWAKGEERSATDALNDLETHGYSTFSNFHKKGYDFEATVMEGGKTIQVLVDPSKGTVTLES
jgi:hypothetical protein